MTRQIACFLLVLSLTTALLGGCSTMPQLGAAAVKTPTHKETADALKDLYAQAQIPPPTLGANPVQIKPPEFAMAGFRLVNARCSDYFDALTKASQTVKMSKADWTAIGTAAAVIATLAKATPKEIGITAAAFGLGTLIIDNYEQYAFATPYPIQTRSLVFKALRAFEESSPPSSATSLDDAADKIAGYARLCTYSGIVSLSEEAIAKAIPVDTAVPGAMFTELQRRLYLDPVTRILNLSVGVTPTENDFVVLAVIADPAVTTPTHLGTLKSLISANIDATTIQTKVVDASNQKMSGSVDLIGGFLAQLAAENPKFAARKESIKASILNGQPPAPIAPLNRQPLIAVQ